MPRVIGIVGSPNRSGRTQEIVRQALAGAAEAGADTELVFLSDHSLPACEDCRPWVCRQTHRCKLDTEGRFAALAERFLAADAVVLGSPVYWGIASEGATAFFQRMHRTHANLGAGKLALGIAIAGGTGGGLVSGLRPLYHFFQMMGLRAIRPLPVTRFNWDQALAEARTLGHDLADASATARPFVGLERLAWYDDLPVIGMSRVEERTLLTSLVVEAVAGSGAAADEAKAAYVEATRLLNLGRRAEALTMIEQAYAGAVRVYEAERGR